MRERICSIDECPLCHRPVWGDGPLDPVCLLAGEAPGADEDTYGIPFCGKSGQELTMYLSEFTKVKREHIHITNLVKCRPPKNRDPHVEEIALCDTYLRSLLQQMKPHVIGAVGRIAAHWFLPQSLPMERLHGIPQYWEGAIVVPLYHPAYGLHSPRQMKSVIEDFTILGKVIRGQVLPRTADNINCEYILMEADDAAI